ncbi:MAG: hypothetical protein QOI53_1670 [Verrucomicrobiota bacterium]|jgi:hypothetical protein|nr:hypothetical protein [Verrucomicrobiota bacterium]
MERRQVSGGDLRAEVLIAHGQSWRSKLDQHFHSVAIEPFEELFFV